MSYCEHDIIFEITDTEDVEFEIDVRDFVDRIVAPDEYTGSTTVTPSDQTQVLETKDKLVRDDITVNPARAPAPDLRLLSVNKNGSYQPDGFDGFSQVDVGVLSIMDNLLEIVSSVTPNENTKSLEFPYDKKPGMYIIVSDPPGTPEFASQQTATQTYSMIEFDIRGIAAGTLRANNGLTICYRKTPSSADETDWWTANVSLGENGVIVRPTQERFSYLAGVTYYLLRVKGV